MYVCVLFVMSASITNITAVSSVLITVPWQRFKSIPVSSQPNRKCLCSCCVLTSLSLSQKCLNSVTEEYEQILVLMTA